MNQNSQENLDQNLLQDYYQALDAINTQHLKLVDAKRELDWHNSRQEEAYQLTKKFGVHEILSLPTANNNYRNTDRNRVAAFFESASKQLKEYMDLVKNNQQIKIDKQEKIKELKSEKDSKLKEVQKNHKSSLEKLNQEKAETANLLRQINQNLESLKTQKMLYFISAVVFAVITTLLIIQIPMKAEGYFWIPIFFTLVYFVFIFYGIEIDDKK
ncbi:MAG: hypothetical protein ACRCU2_33525 [Planktothrix sp.]